MKESLDAITTIIEDYAKGQHSPEALLDMARGLAAHLFYLEKERSEIHKKFEGQKYLLMKTLAANKAETQCNFMYPEMYMLRRVMEGAYKNLDIMRSEISMLKREIHHSNISG